MALTELKELLKLIAYTGGDALKGFSQILQCFLGPVVPFLSIQLDCCSVLVAIQLLPCQCLVLRLLHW